MSLEATMVCVDNSEWTRNGDFAPTRWQAQADAVNLLAGAKTQANPENTVGVLTMGGKTPTVLVTPTGDLGKVLNSMHDLALEGDANLASAVQIAQLALKHRQNKNQRQRIVLFVGSPVSETLEQLVKIGKKLKKNNVAVDVVSFGNSDDNQERLEAFIEAVNSSDNSHLVSVPTGTILSDTLFGSAIYQQEGSGYGGGGGGEEGAAAGGGGGYEFGVDPNLDPELALALRVSLEEERARQGAGGEGGEEAAAGATPSSGAEAGTSAEGGNKAAASAAAADSAEPMDEDELLQQALAMSMAVDETPTGADAATSGGSAGAEHKSVESHPMAEDTAMDDQDDGEMDDELAMALQMSMAEEQAAAPGPSDVFGDADYLNSLLGSLPGVDPNDPALQSTLRDLAGDSKPEAKKDDAKDKQ